MARSADELFMAQALDLARQGIGLASPNPCVGAVIVDERGRIIGRGTHTFEGRKHAEVLAIEEAGPLARGNTLYLNLEPCSHTGRTGPCADAVIAAGIARVVCSMQDPNPQVAGRGFEKLRAGGIEVEVGLLEHEAKKLNESFAKFIRTRTPFVTLKAAMTLDGKISANPVSRNPTAFGASQASTTYITGEQALQRVHELRHGSDAILVGLGTIVADDPMLTDRSGRPRRRPLLRVVLDSHLRTPLESRLVKTCAEDVLLVCTVADEIRCRELESRGVRVQQVSSDANGRPDLTDLLARLGELRITSLLVEGGAMVNSEFLRAGAVDKLWLFYAAQIFGPEALPWLGRGSDHFSARVLNASMHRFGDDFAIEGYLRDPYA